MAILQKAEAGINTPKESLANRITAYLPQKEILAAYEKPDPQSLGRKKIYKKNFPGADYVTVYSTLDEKIVIVPAWHPLNTSSMNSHAGDYGTGIFEGESMEPVYEGQEITGANIILHGPRMERMGRSLKGRLFDLPISHSDFSQAIIDLSAVLGEGVLRDKDGRPTRAYIRPEARPGLGGLGVSLKDDHQIEAGTVMLNWPVYFSDPERVYRGSGLVVAALPEQRLFEIQGKHASNYGAAGRLGKTVKELGEIDEALYFAPYLFNSKTGEKTYINAKAGKEEAALLLESGALADGPGEEMFAITAEGDLFFLPMDVNRLGGTTLKYIVDHLAPKLKIATHERPFTLKDVREGRVISLGFAGNAARIAPIGEIKLFDGGRQNVENLHLEIAEPLKMLVEEYEAEVSGKTLPSHPALLTPVDLKGGEKARQTLDGVYAGWF